MAWRNAFKQPSTALEDRYRVPYFFRKTRQLNWFFILGITQVIFQTLIAEPGWSAEQVVIHYGSFRGAISLDDLEASLEPVSQNQGHLTVSKMPVEVPAGLQTLLTQPLPFLSPEQTNNLFRSPAGESLLEAAAEVFLVGESPAQGAKDLREALVGAATAEHEVIGLNVLRHFPGDIHWDARRTMALLQRRKALQRETRSFLTLLDQSLEQYSGLSAVVGRRHLVTRPWEPEDLRLPGPWAYDPVELKLWDQQRDRRFRAQLYLPRVNAAAGLEARSDLESIPLLVMSHGLAANRHSRSFLAAHLASHGIAIAMIQHPGSDSEQFRELLQGQAETVAAAQSFIDRPQDVSFLLDELHRRTQYKAVTHRVADLKADLKLARYPLRLEQVAVFGHSFGAYTALALAGANINFAQLRQDCQPEAMLLDFSLVLQCQALALEGAQPLPLLRDKRIAALMLADPVSHSIFGPQGLAEVKLPVLWKGGDRDPFTPFMASQLPSFQWLGSEDKHLAIAEATSHVYLKSRSQQQSDDLESVDLTERVVPQPQVVQDYTNALGLAFARTYLQQDIRYRSYLTASYGQQLSRDPYRLRLWSADSRLPELAGGGQR